MALKSFSSNFYDLPGGVISTKEYGEKIKVIYTHDAEKLIYINTPISN